MKSTVFKSLKPAIEVNGIKYTIDSMFAGFSDKVTYSMMIEYWFLHTFDCDGTDVENMLYRDLKHFAENKNMLELKISVYDEVYTIKKLVVEETSIIDVKAYDPKMILA